MKSHEFITEGGWASTLTQGTKITPEVVKHVVTLLAIFEQGLNEFLGQQNIPKIKINNPAGSATYYKRDLVQHPDKEYGDVDVTMSIPRLDGMTNNANAVLIRNQIVEYCKNNKDYQTDNGTNVIVGLGNNQYVQVDLIASFYEAAEWTKALAPEHNVKGVLANSLYSSLGEALSISIGGGHGVQVKTQNGKIVPFRTGKDTELNTITINPKTWAIDIISYFNCTQVSKRLRAYPGMLEEIRIADIINSIIGIAETLELNNKLPSTFTNKDEMLNSIRATYLNKINAVVNSTKFDKAETPEAIAKAEKIKEMLTAKSLEFARLIR